MSKLPKQLTYAQAKELQWFCQNVIGTREEYYSVMEKAEAFDKKLKRLEETCKAIEKFLGEKFEAHPKVDWSEL